jgi:hypothetical protein
MMPFHHFLSSFVRKHIWVWSLPKMIFPWLISCVPNYGSPSFNKLSVLYPFFPYTICSSKHTLRELIVYSPDECIGSNVNLNLANLFFFFYVKDNFINKSLAINQMSRLQKYKTEFLRSICNLNF